MKNSIKIVFVIIASFVGAGFASGKEIQSFFFQYGIMGNVGIIVSSGIISFIIYKVFKICTLNKIYSYNDFCKYLVNNRKSIADFLNDLVNIFLLINFFVMISGFSSLLKQEFNINKTIGALIIIILNYFVAIRDVKGLVKISNLLVPIFIMFLGLIVVQKFNFGILEHTYNYGIANANLCSNWLIKSVLYASYNIIILIPVVVILVKAIKNKKTNYIVSIITFLLINFLSFSVIILLLMEDGNVYGLEMPIIGIVSKFGYVYKIIYIFLIAISIFTTATSSCVSFLNNVARCEKQFKIYLIFISVLAIPISKISFGSLVNCLYPVLGGIGLVEILIILFKGCKKSIINK